MSNEKTEVAAVYISPYDLLEWDKNPRFNDGAVDKIAQSIQKFGFATPIVARSQDKRVISGHTRLKAAKLLNLDKVPVRLIELSEEEADALALADNRLGEIASWDDGLLSEILEDLKNNSFELDSIGFSEQELDQLLGEWEDPFYDDAIDDTGNVDREDREDLVIEDNGQTIISVTVPVVSAKTATELIADTLKDNDIPHQFKVK
jgi:ParB-like chromosome segregation protein Spo0J